MKSILRTVQDKGVRYTALMFICPGCAAGGPEGYDGLHMLPVNSDDIGKPSWTWDGDLESPTLSPSILTTPGSELFSRCHSFLRDGVFQFLSDCTHPLSGQFVPLPDLPDWAADD